VIARAPDGQLGWHHPRGDRHSGPDMRIELLPVGEARFRLTDAQGQSIPKAVLQVSSFSVDAGTEFERQHEVAVLEALQKDFTPIANADNIFVVRGVPLGANIVASVKAAGFSDPVVGWKKQAVCKSALAVRRMSSHWRV
jgi:hypothetical protein